MNEASDGVRDKSSDRKDESQSKDMGKEGGKSTSSLSENASRTPKMVENSGSKQPASDLKPSERYRSDRPSYDKRYESRERPPYGNVNGYKPSGRGRRDFDRRPPKTGKPYRGRGDFKGAGGAGSYRRDERRDPEAKRIYDNQDETRLSKLLKKLQRETERDRKLYTIKQLIDYIHTQEGAKLASRSMEEVLDNLKDVLFERGYKEVKAEVVYCIGLVGTLSGSDAQSYFNWIFGQITSLIEDDIKIMFLQALLEPLKCDEMQWTADFMEMLLGQLQSLLENADTPELLTAVVNVILQLTNTYPKVFQMFFRDTVDILVGWHIDSSQRDRVIEFTSRALVSFRQFWLADQEFTQELLGQFLEDMEAYVEDLGVVSQNADKLGPAPEEISKIGSLLRVFTTVVKSLGPTFDHSKSVELSLPYLIEMFDKVLRAINSSVKSYFSEFIVLAGDECVSELLTMMGSSVIQCETSLLQYLSTIAFPPHPVSNSYTTAAVNLLKKVVEVFGSQLSVSWLTNVLKPASVLQTAKTSISPHVLKSVSAVYKTLLGLRSIALLEETYRHLLGDIEKSFNTLLEACGDEGLVRLVTSTPFQDVTYTAREAETVCMFNLWALGEIGNTKNNLIGMWALSPSLFDLYSERLDVVRPSVSVQYPGLQYAILQALYSHSNTHGNFISTSSLLTQSSPNESSLFASVSPSTSSNFSRLLKVLADLLRHSSTSFDCKLLAVRWVTELVVSLHSSPQVFTTHQFLSLVQALYTVGYDQEEDVASAVHICLTNLFQNPRTYPKYIIKGCVKLCMYRLNEGSEILRDNYFSLICLLPVNVTTSKNNGLYLLEEDSQLVYSEGSVGLDALWQVCRSYSTRPPLGSFHSHNFKQVMGYLLQNQKSKVVGSQAWLDAMFQSAQRPSSKQEWKSTDPLVIQNYISQSPTVQWYWATWEAAQFCVLTRLKTPLGKPQETFTSIEAVLKSLAAQTDGHTDEEEGTENRKKSKPMSGDCRQRVKLVLQFMEQLERHLYNAYEGAAVSMPNLPKAVRTFFRTNKNTCLEWLSRIRMYVIVMALHAGMYTSVVRHASILMLELKDAENVQVSDEICIHYLVQALCLLGEADSVQGVYTWCKDVLGKKMAWIKAAVEKASGRYEVAAKEYRTVIQGLLQTEEDRDETVKSDETGKSDEAPTVPSKITGILGRPSLGPGAALGTRINMFANEVLNCYVQLEDWGSALEWQESYTQLRADTTLGIPAPTYDTDINLIRAMSSFDHEEMGEARQHLDLVMGDGADWGLTCGVQGALCKLVRASTTAHQHAVNNHKSEIMKELTETMDVCEGILKTQCTEWPILASPDVLSMLTMAATLQDHIDNKSVCLLPLSDNLQVDETDHNVSTFLQAIRLVKLQQAISGGVPPVKELSEQLKKLQLSTSSLARKQHNYSLAKSVLNKHAAILLEGRSEVMKGHDLDTLKVSLKELHEVNGASMVDVLRLQREAAKLIHSTGDHRESVELLSGSVVGYVCSEKVRSAVCSKLAARSLLTLVKWLQVDYKLLSSVALGVGQGDGASSLAHNMDDLLMIEERTAASNMRLINQEGTDVKIGDNPILMDTDRIVGRLLHLSTIQCESLPKSWYAFAGWCYKWGRKAVDSASHGSVQLFPDEKTQILSLIPESVIESEKEAVLTILSHVHSGLVSEEDISDQDQSQYDDGTETRRQLIVACEALQTPMGEISLEALLEVWRGVVRRIYHYYQLSASSYFKFLKLNGGTNPLKEQNTEDCNVISTLRVLRLLVKHAWELRAVLEDGLAATPTAPWKGIIPQLFSRLSHPEAYVRQSISDLLCRLAEDAPHLIVYPAVVGSSTSRLDAKTESGLLNNYLAKDGDVDGATEGNSQEEEEIPVETEAESLLHNCILSMLNTLATNFPQMIGDVKQLIKELRRITLLWDELWLGSLNQQHGDVERRISQLETEIKKVNNNSALSKEERTAIIREKHRAVLKPTVYLMERLCEITSQPPETPHETWFQDTYGQLITNALNRLKNPPNPSHPRASWHPFKQIHVSLQQKAQKRNSLMLSMQEISPKLHALRNTVIAMPGLGTAGQIVTIESVSNVVQILPTKTKPKKLVFKGSDGKRYPYLFKGLEDLHLDERIMQFLNIVNNMFAADNKGSHEVFRARHYSVTPLGPRSGLIQWVDGATPLFALYKRWQQREALVQLLKQQASGGASAAQQPSIPRPSEVYYNKLAPLLKEKGIKDLENRKDWPLSVQRKALEELMAETPRDLLARELWCSSNGPNEWWYVTQTFARSTAVMSMIGYIIGLGDRHLDNVLVDLATGEVLHIDYNVCFEKGNSLRVPERVHFRLTQNVEAALGITGIEGTFRLASEHVMKTLRKGRETLLTLLEAFVYDPLVDWTTGNEGGFAGAFYGGGLAPGVGEGRQGKADMEREITSSMFSIRVAEMKVPWIQNRDEIVSVVGRVQTHLDSRLAWVGEYQELIVGEQHSQDLRRLLQEGLGNTSSILHSLHERYKEYVVLKANRDGVNTLVQEKIKECRDWHLMHKHVMNQVQGSAFQKMCNDIASSLSLGTPSFAAAKEFLQGAGQGSVVQQCEQVESELTGHLQLQRTNLTRVIDVLHTYATIVAQFGQSFANNTRTSNYLTWLQELTTDFTEDKCLQIVQHCADLYGDGLFSPARVQLVLAADVRLQTIIQDTNTKLIKLLERRSLEKAEIRLLEQHVIDSRGAIDNFVRENGSFGVSSLCAVVVTVLCALNKRNLQMEAAATGAGDRLMDLTSRDGDWFLEELCSMSGNVAQFIDLVKSCQQGEEGSQLSLMYRGLAVTNHVYTALQDLNVNFRNIILPEALKIIQSEDDSVYGVVSGLEGILADHGGSVGDRGLDTLIAQLEVLHRNAVMGMKNENLELLQRVSSMEAQFKSLLESGMSGSPQELTPGQMLLMGFNGLFTRLEDEFSTLLECIDGLQVPTVWKKVDVIKEAKSLQLSSFTRNTRSLLSSLFFLRRLQVMKEFFHMCTQFAAAILGMEGGNCVDDEQFTRPIKRYIADYVRKQIIGFPSQLLGYIVCVLMEGMGLDVRAEIELKDIGAECKAPLEDLCKKAVDGGLRQGLFQQHHFTQASTLTSALDATWRRHDLTRRLDSNLELLKGSFQRAQLHLTRLHWVQEDVFIQAGIQPSHLMVASRATVMSEIKKCMQSVLGEEASLSHVQSQYSQLEGSITQRLKWAAGANPSLNLILQQFEDASLVRKQLAEEETKISQEVVRLCQGILHLEALRTRTAEAMSSDSNFLTLIQKCNESCRLTGQSSCSVTEQEVTLVQIMPLGEGQRTDTGWMKAALSEVNTQLQDADKKMLALKNSIDDAREGIKTEVNAIRTLLASHHKLMSDIRAILKSLAKQEETEQGDHVSEGSVRQYLNTYKKFSENLTMALKMIVSEEFTAETMAETKALLESLATQIPQIYDELVALAPPLVSASEEPRNGSPVSFATAVKKSSAAGVEEGRRAIPPDLTGTPPTSSPLTTAKPHVSTPVKKAEKISRDPKTGKAIQERNSYAVGVWRRVKMKLDGRDPDQNKRLSVAEQVDYVIKDATNLDNLAVLYEGWTPWV
ncbi:serine/threonine-protein kinase SMG1-like [Mya arenaria]|uniref:serine/threonine-protein kinase SMG1-like n=1 Tax=Mya arenaria TaxID=6604 RepID=UPI0022E0C129|nr:serine/threonine-protein kinase SMG1-like [Mya arenaria]